MSNAIAPAVSAGQVAWVSALIFGFPIAMVLLGEATRVLQRRRHPTLAAVKILRNWVIPALTLYVLLALVIGLPRSDVLVRITETAVWISLIYGALTLLNSVLFTAAQEGSWQAKVPQLFRDLARFMLVLLGSAIVLSTVWGADLGGFLTALGVGSLVLGLALQDSLGNIFSGVALLFEQPIRLGDWVEVGDIRGKVVEVNWRAVHLLRNGDLVVVPNAELGKTTFINMSRPAKTYMKTITVNFAMHDPPNVVREILEHTAREVNGVLDDPPPNASVASFAENAISYTLEFACASYGATSGVTDDLMRRIWYASRREGLTMPYRMQMSMPYQEPAANQPELHRQERLRSLRHSSFAVFPLADLEHLASTCLVRDYGKGEIVLYEGTPLTCLQLIVKGEAELLVAIPGGSQVALGVLRAGEFFGERVALLHNRLADTTVRAASDLRVMMIDGATLNDLIEQQPRLGTDLDGVMDIRQRAMAALHRKDGEPTTQGSQQTRV